MEHTFDIIEYGSKKGQETRAPATIDADDVIVVARVSRALRDARIAPILAHTIILFSASENDDIRAVYLSQDYLADDYFRRSATPVAQFLKECERIGKIRCDELTPENLVEDGVVLRRAPGSFSEQILIPASRLRLAI